MIPFFAFAHQIRRMIHTTNAIESLHSQVRKAVRGRGHFPSDQAPTTLIWLVLGTSPRIRSPLITWHPATAQLAVQFEERFVLSE